MKTVFRCLILVVAILSIMTTCSSDNDDQDYVVFEPWPFGFRIRCEDAAGNNLIPQLKENRIVATWHGKNYLCDSLYTAYIDSLQAIEDSIFNAERDSTQLGESSVMTDYVVKDGFRAPLTRAVHFTFFALYIEDDHLYFGQLDGGDNYYDEQLVIDWGDGSKKDVITFTRYWVTENGKYDIVTRYWVNGVECDKVLIIK